MTVAALLFAESFPIAITDNLISSNLAPDIPPTTPLTGPELRKGNAGKSFPTGLALKVWASEFGFYFLYAGRVDHARQLFDRVEQVVYREQKYTLDRHQNIIDDANYHGLDASFIVVYLDEGFIAYAGDADRQTTLMGKSFGKVLVIGSGRDSLMQAMDTLERRQTLTLPELEPVNLDYATHAIANALAVVGRSSVEYMRAHSAFAQQSTGALFNISYFPNLYGWSVTNPAPGWLANRLCQIFTHSDGTGTYLTRLVVTRQEVGCTHLETFFFSGHQKLDLAQDEFTLDLRNLTLSRIRALYDDSESSEMPVLEEDLALYQVIVYGQKDAPGMPPAISHTVTYDCRSASLTIANVAGALRFTLHQPLIRNLWARINRETALLPTRTPLILHPGLSTAKRRIWLKLENLQPSGSYKLRGMSALCAYAASLGKFRLFCPSGGNAGLATAIAARNLGLQACIVVPTTTPEATRARIRRAGGEVVVHGDLWEESNQRALSLASDSDAFYVPAFDHPMLWEGHSSLVDEILEDCPNVDSIVSSVGGGGLLAGILTGLERHKRYDCKIITCETAGAASFQAAMAAGKPVRLPRIDTVAKSLAASQVAAWPVEHIRAFAHECVVLSDADAMMGVARYADDLRQLVEPACGVSLAVAYLDHPAIAEAHDVVIIVCGGVSITAELVAQWQQSV